MTTQEVVSALRAEVERLRAELAERASPGALQDMFARLGDTEYRLAAANALLERWLDAEPGNGPDPETRDHLAAQKDGGAN